MASKVLRMAVIVVMVCVVFATTTFPSVARVTADSFEVKDAYGYENTSVLVPVNISDVQEGPVKCIIFNIEYDTSVVKITEVRRGALTSTWDPPYFNDNLSWGTRVLLVYSGWWNETIENETSGSVALLNFSVVGEIDDECWMNLSDYNWLVRTIK